MENGYTDNQRKINNVLLVRSIQNIQKTNIDIIRVYLYIFFSISGMFIYTKGNVVLSLSNYIKTICKIFSLMPQFQIGN